MGRVIEYVYLDNGWLQNEIWKTSGGSTVNTISYTYNDNGQPLTITDNAGTITHTYDILDRLDTATDVHGLWLDYDYDNANRVTQVTDSEGGTRLYSYDTTNRLEYTTFTDGTNQLGVEFTYNNRDELTLVERYSDTARTTLIGKTAYGYDDGGRLEEIDHQDSSGVTINDFLYVYDDANRLTSMTSTLSTNRTYDYDDTNQLLSDGTNNWTYDANGNRTNSGYTTTTGNRYSTDGTWDYTYDNEGNRISRENISSGEYWEYGYDHKNRLTSVVTKNSSGGSVIQEVEFTYDALGRRVEKSVDPDGAGSTPATIEKFGYDPNGNAWADLDGSGSLTTRRLYHNAVDALFARIDSNVDWYLADHQGSITDMTDSSGILQDHIEYDGYGNVISESNSSFGDRYKYTSREWDAEIDLQYNRARFYDPSIGRWISEDPIGFSAGDRNLNRYVGNMPTMSVDPSGLQGHDLAAALRNHSQNQNLPSHPGILVGNRTNICHPGYAESNRIGMQRLSDGIDSTVEFYNSELATVMADMAQLTADIAGIFDPTPISDGVGLVISASRFDLLGAGCSIAGFLPYLGDSLKFLKIGEWVQRGLRAVRFAGESAANSQLLRPLMRGLYDVLNRVPVHRLPESAARQLERLRDAVGRVLAPNGGGWAARLGGKDLEIMQGAAGSTTRNAGFMNHLGAVAETTAANIPGGQVHLLGRINGSSVYGSLVSGTGIAEINGVTMVVKQTSTGFEILGPFIP